MARVGSGPRHKVDQVMSLVLKALPTLTLCSLAANTPRHHPLLPTNPNSGTIGIWKRKSFLTAGTTWLAVVSMETMDD